MNSKHLVTTLKASDFVERNDFLTVLMLFRDWSAIILVASFSIWANNLGVYLVAIWVIGIFQFAIGESITHEASHYNLFRKAKWNDQFDFLYALPFLSTVSFYRKHHSLHHKYLGLEQDHLVANYKHLGLYEPQQNLFFTWFIKPIIGFSTLYLLLGKNTGIFYELKHLDYRRFKSGSNLVIFWLITLLCFLISGNINLLIMYWFIPFLWPYACFLYWSEIRDHFNTKSGTRSSLNFLYNFLTHHNGIHYVHHLHPNIPWYNLPKAQKSLYPVLLDTSYNFFDTYKQLITQPQKEGIHS